MAEPLADDFDVDVCTKEDFSCLLGVCQQSRSGVRLAAPHSWATLTDVCLQKAEVTKQSSVLRRFGLSIGATLHPGLARIRRWRVSQLRM